MNLFEVLQSFIERSAGEPSITQLAEQFQLALEMLGFRYFACCPHVDPSSVPEGSILVHSYPVKWERIFVEEKFHSVDPVLRYADRSNIPFLWTAPDFLLQTTPAQRRILGEASLLGIARVRTFPIQLSWIPGSVRASCSLIPDSESVDQPHYFAAWLMAMRLCDAAHRAESSSPEKAAQRRLTRRERQCLELAAQGKSDWAIGQLLKISEHTVHRHMESAKQRLGVSTRIQAAILALREHQISFGDAIRADTEFSSEWRRRRTIAD